MILPKVVQVEWFDISSRSGWHEVHEAKGNYKVISIGYLLSLDDNAVIIAQSIAENDLLAASLTIPKVNVKKITRIK